MFGSNKGKQQQQPPQQTNETPQPPAKRKHTEYHDPDYATATLAKRVCDNNEEGVNANDNNNIATASAITSSMFATANSNAAAAPRYQRICDIIAREFQQEIDFKHQQLEQIDERLQQSMHLLDRLRYAIVADYYRKQTLQLSAADAANVRGSQTLFDDDAARGPQMALHPSLKKIIGKKPKTYEEILRACPRRAAAQTAKHTIHVKSLSNKKRERRLQQLIREEGIVIDHSKQAEAPTCSSALVAAEFAASTGTLASCSSSSSALASSTVQRSKVSAPQPPAFRSVAPVKTLNAARLNNKIKHLIVVGNTSKYIGADADEQQSASATCSSAAAANRKLSHKWLVYVQTKDSHMQIEQFVKKVRFYLHASYRPNDVVDICTPPFQIARRGWGEFPMRIQLYFADALQQKPVQLVHNLVLDKTLSGLQTLGAETLVEIWLRAEHIPGNSSNSNNKTFKKITNCSSNSAKTQAFLAAQLMPATLESPSASAERKISFAHNREIDDHLFDFLNTIEATPICADIEKIQPTVMVTVALTNFTAAAATAVTATMNSNRLSGGKNRSPLKLQAATKLTASTAVQSNYGNNLVEQHMLQATSTPTTFAANIAAAAATTSLATNAKLAATKVASKLATTKEASKLATTKVASKLAATNAASNVASNVVTNTVATKAASKLVATKAASKLIATNAATSLASKLTATNTATNVAANVATKVASKVAATNVSTNVATNVTTNVSTHNASKVASKLITTNVAPNITTTKVDSKLATTIAASKLATTNSSSAITTPASPTTLNNLRLMPNNKTSFIVSNGKLVLTQTRAPLNHQQQPQLLQQTAVTSTSLAAAVNGAVSSSSTSSSSTTVQPKKILQKKLVQIVDAAGNVKYMQMLVATSMVPSATTTTTLTASTLTGKGATLHNATSPTTVNNINTKTLPPQLLKNVTASKLKTDIATIQKPQISPTVTAITKTAVSATTINQTINSTITKTTTQAATKAIASGNGSKLLHSSSLPNTRQSLQQNNSNNPSKNVVFQREGKVYIIDPMQVKLRQQQRKQMSLLKPQVSLLKQQQQTQQPKATSLLQSVKAPQQQQQLTSAATKLQQQQILQTVMQQTATVSSPIRAATTQATAAVAVLTAEQKATTQQKLNNDHDYMLALQRNRVATTKVMTAVINAETTATAMDATAPKAAAKTAAPITTKTAATTAETTSTPQYMKSAPFCTPSAPALHLGIKQARFNASNALEQLQQRRQQLEQQFLATPFSGTQAAVEYLLRQLPLVQQPTTDKTAAAPATATTRCLYPFVQQTWQHFNALPALKQRALEWLRAKHIARQLKKHLALNNNSEKNVDNNKMNTFNNRINNINKNLYKNKSKNLDINRNSKNMLWSTREIALFARHHAYTPPLKTFMPPAQHEADDDVSKAVTNNSNKHEDFTALLQNELQQTSSSITYDTLSASTRLSSWIETQLQQAQHQAHALHDADNIEIVEVDNEDVEKAKIADASSPLKLNHTKTGDNLLYLSPPEHLSHESAIVSHVCRAAGLRLQPEPLNDEVLHPVAQTLLASCVRLFVEQLMRQALGLKSLKQQQQSSLCAVADTAATRLIAPHDIAKAIGACAQFDFLSHRHFGAVKAAVATAPDDELEARK